MNKVFQGLYCDTASSLVYYSQPVSMGQANSAMIEGWLISASNLDDVVTLSLEGSNDGQVWTPIKDTATPTAMPVEIELATTAPDYKESSGQRCIIGFAQVRIKVTLIESSSPAGKCVLDASIRTFQTA